MNAYIAKMGKPMKATRYVLEIDYHRGGRCYAMQGGITTTNIAQAFARTDRKAIEALAKRYSALNPAIVTKP